MQRAATPPPQNISTPAAAPSVAPAPSAAAPTPQLEQPVNLEWATFLAKLRTSSTDVVLQAILEQAAYKITASGELTLSLKQNSKFFTEKLEEVKPAWFPLLQEALGPIKKILFDQLPQSVVPPKALPKDPQSSSPPPQSPRPRPTQPVANPNVNPYKTFKPVTAPKISDVEGEFITPTAALPFASLLVTHFPGRLKRLKNHI